MTPFRWSLLTFILIATFGFGARQAIGTVYGSGEAIALLEALARSGLYLGSATATASATTLALMLTLIGMVRRAETEFDSQIYGNINTIAQLCFVSLIVSLMLLLVLVFPVGEFEDIPDRWYPMLYEILFGATVLVVALLSMTVTMLYLTIRFVISEITPGDNI